jgi:hypothetical protein
MQQMILPQIPEEPESSATVMGAIVEQLVIEVT